MANRRTQITGLKLVLSFNLLFIWPYENKAESEPAHPEQPPPFCMLPHAALLMHLNLPAQKIIFS